jgi:putative sporulation protein YyaC
MNLAECIAQLNAEHADKTVIAIDACLGQLTSVGVVMCGNGPIMPGAGVGKELPPVGEYFISGIVNVGGFMEYFVLQNTRLSLVVRMADDIAAAIVNVLPITEASAIA